MLPIDLHAHTNHSDGSDTPTELVAVAQEVGLSLLAVTDHDTFSALPEARRAAEGSSLEILTGAEITAHVSEGVIHVLAYDFDEEDPDLLALLQEIRDGRAARNAAILDKLSGLGIHITPEDVAAEAAGTVVARPHIAAALLTRGHVKELQEAFKLWLHDGGPAYVPVQAPRPEQVVECIRDAGGVSVFAHPKSLRLRGRAAYRVLFRDLKRHGLTGIEVDHPSHRSDHRSRFLALAKELDLVPSGGSDYHGSMKPWIRLGEGDGTIDVRRDTWDRLSERRSG